MHPTNGRAAIEAVDLLLWEVVTASGELAQGPDAGLSRLLREGAAEALAGIGAACREESRHRGVDRLDRVRDRLRRLGTWLDLAERFGDLPSIRALAALEAQGRALGAVDALRTSWVAEGRSAAPRRPDYATIEIAPPVQAIA